MGSYGQLLLALLLLAPLALAATGPMDAVLIAQDSGELDNDLVPTVNASRVAGVNGTALRMLGYGGSANATGTLGASAGAMTWAAWVRSDASTGGAQDILMTRASTGNAPRYGIRITNAANIQCLANPGGVLATYTHGTPAVIGAWHHVACVYDGAALSGYVNGTLGAAPVATSGTLAATNHPVTLGTGMMTNNGGLCACTVDEVRVYLGSAYNETEIGDMRDVSPSAPTTNLSAYWRFDEAWDYGPPTASFVAATFGTNITTDASASHSHAGLELNYSWDWGDSTPVSYGANQSHSYGALGTYAVTLTVTEASTGYTDTVVENVTIDATYTSLSTAFDAYIPVILWGGLAFVFLYFTAWAPAIAAMMALGNHLLAAPIWGLPASAMLVLLMLALHVLVVRGIIPTRWGR